MRVLCESLFIVILAFLGYIATCGYLNDIKWNRFSFKSLKPNSKNRIVYLVVAIAVELSLIVLFNTLYINNTWIHQFKLLFLVAFLVPVAAIDNRRHVIPNVFIIAALIVRCVFYISELISSSSNTWTILKDNLLGALVIGIFFLLISLIFKNSIGMGDVKLFAVMGMYQGLWGAINSVFFSLVVSFVLSIMLLITHRKKRKDTISFAPSILLGTVIAIGLTGI